MSVVLRGISGNLADVNASGELKIAGTITATATNPSIGLFGDPVPLSGTTIAGPDGSGNLRAPAVLNTTPAGTEYALVVRTIGGSSGGVANLQVRSVANAWTDIGYFAGNLSVPVDVRNTSLAITAASLPLPTGAATETTLGGVLTTAAFQARVPVNGQALMAASIPVVLASDQSTIAISATSLPLPTGAATETTLASRLSEATFTTRIPLVGQKAMSESIPVTIATDQSPLEIEGIVVDGGTWGTNRPLVIGGVVESTDIVRKIAITNTGRLLVEDQTSNALAAGSIAANGQSVTLAVATNESFAIQVTGTWVGSMEIQGSPDGGFNWIRLECFQPDATGSEGVTSTFTTNGVFQPLNPQGMTHIRAHSFAWTSGIAQVNISGTASGLGFNPSLRENGSTIASYANQMGASDGTLLRFIRSDTNGYLYSQGMGVAGTPSGGVLSIQGVGGGTAIAISAASLPLPTGAATEATLGTLLTTSAFQARIPVLGQALMAASIPVTLASNQSALAVSQSGTWNIGTLTSITNTVTTQDTASAISGGALPSRALQVAGSDGSNLRPIKTDPQGRVATYQQSGTASVTRVATSGTSATLLTANAARKGAIIVNESAAVMFVKYGATASATSYTYRITANGVLVIDFGWTGQIDAILSTGSGNAQITELLD